MTATGRKQTVIASRKQTFQRPVFKQSVLDHRGKGNLTGSSTRAWMCFAGVCLEYLLLGTALGNKIIKNTGLV